MIKSKKNQIGKKKKSRSNANTSLEGQFFINYSDLKNMFLRCQTTDNFSHLRAKSI